MFSVCSISLVLSVVLLYILNFQSCTHYQREREREREREAVNMHGTMFTLARLKIVPMIKNLICRCLLYDCEM